MKNELQITLTLNNERLDILKKYSPQINDKELLRDSIIIFADLIATLRHSSEGIDAVTDLRDELLDKYFNK